MPNPEIQDAFRQRRLAVRSAEAMRADLTRLCPHCNSVLLPGQTVEDCDGCRLGRQLREARDEGRL